MRFVVVEFLKRLNAAEKICFGVCSVVVSKRFGVETSVAVSAHPL
jgi:hypothetical protein